MSKLKNIVKGNKIIYKLYFYFGSLFLKIMSIFVPQDKNTMLFVVYGGERYDDSPRFVYEELKRNPLFNDYKMYWAFKRPSEIDADIPQEYRIKIDTMSYYITALKSKYWITNSSCSRGLNFKKSTTINIFFSHGMAGIKKLGSHLKKDNKSFKDFKETFDYIITQGGEAEEEILKDAWNLTERTKILKFGLARNDELANFTQDRVKSLKLKLGIPLDKKVIMYAPTFREYNKDTSLATYLNPPIDFSKWKKQLSNEYVMLVTAHYEVQNLLNIPKDDFIIDAFKYPFINDLMIVSDLLISDYSSIVFDFCILERPVLSFAYDYDVYQKERGIYQGYSDLFYKGINQDEDNLISIIKNIDYKKASKQSRKIKEERIVYNGQSAKIFVDFFVNEVI